jgi:hypothetical protein
MFWMLAQAASSKLCRSPVCEIDRAGDSCQRPAPATNPGTRAQKPGSSLAAPSAPQHFPPPIGPRVPRRLADTAALPAGDKRKSMLFPQFLRRGTFKSREIVEGEPFAKGTSSQKQGTFGPFRPKRYLFAFFSCNEGVFICDTFMVFEKSA